ncbi:GNAT family N-acetyltransferase [Pseudomonas fluorescens]|uniref:GNAT family N-acetyltransferase n=1 Tax=Pseudomonas TaxID=286 RepID=UPI003CFF3203
MKPIRIRTLQSADTEALLTFERDNREWFERHIDARNSAFYSIQGVTDHIAAYLSDFAAGTWHPFVLEDPDGNIVGRANLKGIDIAERSAEVLERCGFSIEHASRQEGTQQEGTEHDYRFGLSI